jgi:hypothetical protein
MAIILPVVVDFRARVVRTGPDDLAVHEGSPAGTPDG